MRFVKNNSVMKSSIIVATLAFLLTMSGCFGSHFGGGSLSCTNCPPPPPKPSFLYATAVNDISSFSLGSSGVPTSLGNQSGPNQTEGIVVDPSNRFLYVSDFLNGSLDAFTINASSGALTQVTGSPFSAGPAPGTGGITVDPGSKFLYATLMNSAAVAGFTINASTGALTPIAGSPFAAGNTPIQAIVDPSGKFLYVSNLNDSMGGISAYTIDSTSGALTPVAGSPFSTQANFPGPSGLAIDGGGKFLYVSMSGTVNANNVVSGFAIDSTTGTLTQIAGSPFTTGKDPLRVATDPAGRFLLTANSQDSTVSAFTIDSTSGGLTPVPGSPFATPLGAPEAVVVDPTGGLVYVGTSGSAGLFAFHIDTATGALSSVVGSPFFGQSLNGVAIAKP